MDKAELGFYAKAGLMKHNAGLSGLEGWCVDAIRTYNSRPGHPCIPARTLADMLDLDTRSLRTLINHLISREYHGLPIFPQPGNGGGYFMADTPQLKERAKGSIDIQLARAKTSARKARDLGANDQELAKSVVQLTLDLGPGVEKEVVYKLGRRIKRQPATHKQVLRLLKRYSADPDAFAAEIAELRAEFAGVFVRKEDLTRVMRKQTEAAIEAAVAELSGHKAA